MWKRLLPAALILLLTLWIACASAATFGDYEYQQKPDGSLIITAYTGRDKEVTVPDTIDDCTVTDIGPLSFRGCDALETVILPDTVITIGDRAFLGCGLTGFDLPKSVETIGINPFSGCRKLKEITVHPGQDTFVIIDGMLCNRPQKLLISYPAGRKDNDLKLPEGVTTVGAYAFHRSSSVKKVTLCDTVVTLEHHAFADCNAMTEVVLNDRLTTIGEAAFSYCASLKEIMLPDSVTAMGKEVFLGCKGMKNAVMPAGMDVIAAGTFTDCTSLRNVSLPVGLRRV